MDDWFWANGIFFLNVFIVTAEEPSFRPTGLAILIARTGLVGVVIYALFFLSLWRMSAEGCQSGVF